MAGFGAKLTIAISVHHLNWSTKQLTAVRPDQMTLSCSSAAISAADKPSQSP
jgi:hypothetical protein